MKLVSWNVNGLRSSLSKGFIEKFREIDADVFCMQETKMEQGQAEIDLDDYEKYFNSADKKGYSGTAIFTRIKPLSVQYDLGIEEHDHEGRVITLEFEEFYLVNVYTPNSKRELERLDYRMVWENDFRNFLLNLNKTKPVVLCGDLNVAHTEIDVKNDKANRGKCGFTEEERGKFTELLQSGFIDTYRHFYPTKDDAFSWWSYMGKAREKNVGWRIDYFLISKDILGKLESANILPMVLGSDHCPVVLELKI